jgi:phosphoribosylaminoimidazolecarboxamide formyltransferase/IMP cyclohydrolase
MNPLPIRRALVSVYDKKGLEPLVRYLHSVGVELISTGGTGSFLSECDIPYVKVEDLTGYPELLDGRVKTLHPAIFGALLHRGELDQEVLSNHLIRAIDMVIVHLYPFEETLALGGDESALTEKIDIGGVSLLRAAAKNFKHVLTVSDQGQYEEVLQQLKECEGLVSEGMRKSYAGKAFSITSAYDTAISFWLRGLPPVPPLCGLREIPLRYGENPHQRGWFSGDFEALFTQLHGKELSYNNVLDIDAGLRLLAELPSGSIAILKHNNPCGVGVSNSSVSAWEAALSGDPVSAFGGVIVSHHRVDLALARAVDSLFFEAFIAPGFDSEAFEVLSKKKNRILLQLKSEMHIGLSYRTLLNGVLWQDVDDTLAKTSDWEWVSGTDQDERIRADLKLANVLSKHAKSNAMVLVKEGRLVGMGCGHVSRIDALKHALVKASEFGLEVRGAVLGSDAFFPFPDCVQLAFEAGISAIIQPGGSVKDADSVHTASRLGIAMVFTGIRHFRH